MENLKLIWNEFLEREGEIEKIVASNSLESTFRQIKVKEKKRLRVSQALPVIYIILMAGLLFILKINGFFDEKNVLISQVIGIVLLFLGLFWLIYQFRKTIIPIQQSNFDLNSSLFMQSVKLKLIERKKLIIWGTGIYLLFLILGVNLIINPYLQNYNEYGGIIGLFYGSMLSVGGLLITYQTKIFNNNYKAILHKINEFIK